MPQKHINRIAIFISAIFVRIASVSQAETGRFQEELLNNNKNNMVQIIGG